MSENKTVKKFNILDILFILVILLVLVYGVYSYMSGGETVSNVKVNVGIEVTQLSDYMYDGLEKGMKVSDHVQNLSFGVLESVEVKPSRIITDNMVKGRYELAEIPEKYDALLNVNVDAKVSGSDLMKDNTKLKIGTKVTVRVGSTAYNGVIVAVDYDENEFKEAGGNA